MYVFTDQGNTVIEADAPKSHFGDVKAIRNDSYRNELQRQMFEKKNRDIAAKITDISLDN